MSCEVCSGNESRYKCPKCYTKYCSLPCYKMHQKNVCIERSGRTKDTTEYTSTNLEPAKRDLSEDDLQDEVSQQNLSKLGESTVIRDMLSNPHLAQIVCHLDCSEQPNIAIEAAMHEPIFTEFVDECLRIIEPPTRLS